MIKKNYLNPVCLLMICLIISIPFHTSNVMADSLSDVTGMAVDHEEDIIDAGQACVEKNKKTSELVELLDNDIINVLEQLTRVMHAISSLWTVIKNISLTIALVLYEIGWTSAAGWIKQKWVVGVDTVMMPINNMLGCSWADWCSFEIPGSSGLVAGSNNNIPIKISPNSNMYAAVACLCPTAVLLNMRKLKTIYQTYNCCIEEACKNGYNTLSCERQLSEAECMFWGKGAIASMVLNIALGIIAYILSRYVIEVLGKEWVEYSGAVLGVLMLPFEIENLMKAMEDMGKAFDEPDCSELGFDKIRDEGSPDGR